MKRLLSRLRAWLFRPIEPEPEAETGTMDPYLLRLITEGYVDADEFLADIEDNTANFYIEQEELDR